MNRIFIASLAALAALTVFTGCEQKPKAEQLPAPVPVVASTGINNATLMWEKVKNAASYQVVLNDDAPLSTEGSTITIQGLSPSTTYSLKMKAIAPEGSTEWLDSDFSEPISFTTSGKKPLGKPELTVSDILASGFKVSWKAVKNAEKYVYKVGDAEEKETTDLSFTADGLKHSTEYTVKVKAVPSAAQAEFSVDSEWAETKATTAGKTTLTAPALSSGSIHTNGFTISWAAIPGAGKYNYKINSGTVQTTTDISVAFNSLTALTTYTVEVQAAPSDANAANYDSSTWASIQVKTLDLVTLGAPQLKSESILATEFTVTWQAVENAGAYMCSLNGANYTKVSGTSVKYEGLHTETAYNVKVYAIPSEAGKATYKDSPVSSIDVTTKKGESPDDKGGNLSDFTEKPII